MQHRHAFTLIEMSIVLVIIGLLVGGIMIGQSMIAGSEVTRMGRDASTAASAISLFKDRYGALPGDYNEATKMWGDNVNLCADATVTDGTPGACNGNGNGIVEQTGSLREDLSVWMDLGSAGVYPGNYDYGSTNTEPQYRGFTYPPTVRAGAMTFKYYGPSPNTYSIYTFPGHYIKLGVPVTAVANVSGAIVSPQEAIALDRQIDDGVATTGQLKAGNGYYNGATQSCVDGSNNYVKSTSALACVLYYSTDNK